MPQGSRDAEGARISPGQADAGAVREALKRPPPPSRRRGRGVEEPPADAGAELAQIPEELVRNYGEEVRTYFNEIAKARGYEEIPERAVGKIGLPAAAVAEKWGLARAVMKWPELALLMALFPYLFNVARVEFARWRESKEKEQEPQDRSRADAPARAAGVTDAEELHRRTAAASGAPPQQPRWEGAPLEG